MSKDLDNKYFIILHKDKIIFSCLNNENKISFTKKYTLINSLNNLFEELEIFFIDNLYEIERGLKNFIKKVYVIFDTDYSLSAYLSIKYNLETEIINENKIKDLVSYLKYQFTKYNNDQKIIHMSISKLLIDGEEKDIFFVKDTFNNLILEVKLECLKNQIVYNIKKICSNYQISVDKIFLANHLRQSIEDYTDDVVFLANKILSGQNKKEIFLTNKKIIKSGFFERFFKFFS